MAQATTLRFGKGVLYMGDAATPTEAFAAICGFWRSRCQSTRI